MAETVMPDASCVLGYTQQDLESNWGAKEGEPHPLWDQLNGQTGAICTGCSMGGPHGLISYVGDVQEWVEHRPVSDW